MFVYLLMIDDLFDCFHGANMHNVQITYTARDTLQYSEQRECLLYWES